MGLGGLAANGIAYGDFDGDGATDVLMTPVDGTRSPRPVAIFRGPLFEEATSEVVEGAIPGTVHGRKAIVADFDGDGRPDVYLADHGYDQPPFPGAKDVLLLSGGAGRLQWVQSLAEPVGFHHGAAAGDVDNDGDVDIFVTDSNGRCSRDRG